MYKISVPLMCGNITRAGRDDLLAHLRELNAERVFLALSTYEFDPLAKKRVLDELADHCAFFHEQGFEVSCNLAYGIDWDNEENQRIFERELALLIDYYIKNPTVKPAAILDINRIKSLAEEQETVRYCGAGYAMRAYDCDGTYYPCQFFLPICVGEEEAKRALEEAKSKQS